MDVKTVVEKYQCCGCINCDEMSCFTKNTKILKECSAHVAGTYVIPHGKIYLGLPKGFNRFGVQENYDLNIFENFEDYTKYWGDPTLYDFPAWKHFDGEATLIKVFSPRINRFSLAIVLGDCISEIDCREITDEDINHMD